MSKKSFDPKECISLLNNIKQGMQMSDLPFTKKTILNSLKECGLPNNATFWTVFRNSGILKEISKGKFKFASKDPIYVGLLDDIKTKYQTLRNRYQTKHRESKILKDDNKNPIPENDPVALTQFAIDHLKEQGYQILAPIGILYQKL